MRQTPRGSEEGVVAVFVAILSLVLFGFAALIVDLGMARDMKVEASDAADAGALAGAADLRSCTNRRCTAATRAIRRSVFENLGIPTTAWSSCRPDTPPPATDFRPRRSGACIQYSPRSGEPDQVFVALPKQRSPVFFGGILGFGGVDISAHAIAGTQAEPGVSCALCVQGTVTASAGTLGVVGGGSLYARDGAATGGSVTSLAGTFLTNEPTGTTTNFTPPAQVTDEAPVDPFAGQVLSGSAPPGGTPGTCDGSGGPLDPGQYASLEVVGACSLSSGMYRFTGDLVVRDGASLAGRNVTVELQGGGSITVEGTGVVDIGDPASGEVFVLFSDTGGGSVTIDAGATLIVAGDVSAGSRDLVSAGNVSISGTTVFEDVSVNGGQLSVNSPGSGAPQAGSTYLGLIQ